MKIFLAGALAFMAAGTVHAATLTFEDFATNTEINSFSVGGITATVSTESNRSGGTDKAVVFDSANPTGNDTDLASPFTHSGGTLGNLAPGKILIISGPQNGNLSLPDDDAQGGTITFMFNQLVDVTGFNYFDTEAGGNQLVVGTDTGFTSGSLIAGDGKYDIFSTRLNGVRSLTFDFGGSGAIDDISFVATVPVPAALPLLLAGLGGLAWVGRRRKRT